MLQQDRFTIGVAHRTVAVSLDARDVARQPRPLAERRDEHGVDIVEALSQSRQILLRHDRSALSVPSMAQKQNRRSLFGSGGFREVWLSCCDFLNGSAPGTAGKAAIR